VVLEGELDLASAPEIRRSVADAISTGDGDVVVDLSKVTFMGATGLNVLVSARNRLGAADRRLIVRCPSASVRRILAICQMDQIVEIEED
jgi:anti-anti-sigma factor